MNKKASTKSGFRKKEAPIELLFESQKPHSVVSAMIVAILYVSICLLWYFFSNPLFILLFGENAGESILSKYGVFFYVLFAVFIHTSVLSNRLKKDRRSSTLFVKQLQDTAAKNEELKQLNIKYGLVIQGSNDGIWEWDIENDTFTFSEQWLSKFGFTDETAPKSSKDVVQRILPSDRLRVLRSMREYRQKQFGKYECTFGFLMPSGEARTVLSKGQAVWIDGIATRMAGSHTDVTNMMILQEQLYQRAYFDELTSLPSKLSLEEYVADIIGNEPNRAFSLIYLDIDDFKHINQVIGHHGGDTLLIEIASLLRKSISNRDFLSRVGGDEFVIIHMKDELFDSVIRYVDSVLEKVEKVFTIESLNYYVAFSVGISHHPEHGDSFSKLFQKADTALHEAKSRGKDQIVLYEESMSEVVKNIIELSSHIRFAIVDKQLVLHYQPIIDLKTKRVHGYEALLRWVHPSRGLIMPGNFLPLASTTPLIGIIDSYVLEEAFKQKQKWELDHMQKITLSINLSRQTLFSPTLLNEIVELLKKYPIVTSEIIFEITEYTAFASHLETVISVLNRLRNLGFLIAMDDFGSGYSSLTNLERLPLDIVKIDRSFIAKTLSSPRNQRIIKTMIDLIHSLGMYVTCEGVEHLDQLNSVEEFQSDFVQGFYFSAAVEEEKLLDLTNKHIYRAG